MEGIIGIISIILTTLVIFLTIHYEKKRRIDSVVNNFRLGSISGCPLLYALKSSGICELKKRDLIVSAIKKIENRHAINPLRESQFITNDKIENLYRRKDLAKIIMACNQTKSLKSVMMENNV